MSGDWKNQLNCVVNLDYPKDLYQKYLQGFIGLIYIDPASNFINELL
jgi:hypothetical protein